MTDYGKIFTTYAEQKGRTGTGEAWRVVVCDLEVKGIVTRHAMDEF